MEKIKKILILEDEMALLRAIKDKMEINQFIVETAKNGEEGLQKIKKFQPDLILLDLMMPKVSGETFLKKIKENKKYASIPVIVISAKADDATIKNCLENLGADDFMVKANFTLKSLVDKINGWNK